MKSYSLNKFFAPLAMATALLCGCGTDDNDIPQNPHHDVNQKDVNKGLIESHKEFIKQQDDEIQQYIKRRNYDMQKTASGIYYMFEEHGKGEQAKGGEIASVNYKISLMKDGTVCYDTKDSVKQIKVAEDNVETGVHEAVQIMHVGDKALFIIPSDLANGLVGDRSKIPPGAIVIYDIKLIAVQQAKPALSK